MTQIAYVLILHALIQSSTSVYGTVSAQATGEPIAYAAVGIEELGLRVLADSAGAYTLAGIPAGRFEVRASAPGYGARSVAVETEDSGRIRVDFALEVEPIRLRALTARSERRRQRGGAAEGALFDREVAPGVIGMSGQAIRDVPVAAEPDMLRSLAALPDVAVLNDLSAQLHVQGGAPDQNLFLLDGAKVFAPYHLFGLFGAFNADAIGRVDFYRGHLPARFGGALSSVIDVAAPTPVAGPVQVEGGFSLLSARATARGSARGGDAQWLLGLRRTHADLFIPRLFDTDVPYGFVDAQARGTFRLDAREHVSASAFASSDRFDMFFDADVGSLDSRWRNAAGSVRWERGGETVGRSVTLWMSHYGGSLRVGRADRSPVTRNDIAVAGLKYTVSLPGGDVGYRLGAEIEGGKIDLEGSDEPGGYVTGASRAGYLLATGWAEAEAWWGPVRFTPGLRLAFEAAAARPFIEPRLSGRIELTDGLAITAGLSRTHQFLSTLRDDRYPVPGAPMWVLHSKDAPVSRADGLSVSLDGWRGTAWSIHTTGYLRRQTNIARWRPVGDRRVDRLAFDDGWARGASIMIRRHEGSLRGWAGYSASSVRLTETGSGHDYSAAWDRRHSLDVAIFLHPADWMTLSTRATYATGRPFWPQVGELAGSRFDPLSGVNQPGEKYPAFSSEQMRYPDDFRLDFTLRFRARVGPLYLEPYLSVLNATLRRNVLYYRLAPGPHTFDPEEEVPERPMLEPAHVLPFFPSVGMDVRF